MRIILYPYKIGSESCRQVAAALTANGRKIIRVHPDKSYRPRSSDFIINWGSAKEPNWAYDKMLNPPIAVANAVDKLKTFQILKEAGVRTVPFTTSPQEASNWPLICARLVLNGHSGQGIRVVTKDNLINAPLYTQMLTPSEEYRVHVFKGEVIDYAKKMRRLADGTVTAADEVHIKNSDNGFEFIRDVSPREGVCKRAIEAVNALGLDFGAVDVIRHNDKSYVLEVGTAAGLSPKGVQAYANKIIQYATQ